LKRKRQLKIDYSVVHSLENNNGTSTTTKYLKNEISIRAMLIPTENDILWIFHVTNKLKN